ncbi:hypothetical protein [Flavobacterium sp.]|uniref:hypothetical protein n=1 Tax=Flavobacterium sp. TaxID=239 RepID=UPI0022BEEED5|nr:hypothetical protein [Flavobacterium sp.]MCZ8144899.1 hypothetical protein [Flavobacterium sp.]
MKKLLFICLMSLTGFAQDKFEYSKSGMTDYVVTEVPGTAAENYQKVLKWIKENYKNPDEVIKTTIENELIRIEGFESKFHCVSSMGTQVCSGLRYYVDIKFKDGKINFDPIELKNENQAGSFAIPMNDLSIYYKSDGSIKKSYSESLDRTVSFLNTMNNDITTYIKVGKKNDW